MSNKNMKEYIFMHNKLYLASIKDIDIFIKRFKSRPQHWFVWEEDLAKASKLIQKKVRKII